MVNKMVATGKSEHLLDNEEADAPPNKTANGTMQTIAGVMGNVLEWYELHLFRTTFDTPVCGAHF